MYNLINGVCDMVMYEGKAVVKWRIPGNHHITVNGKSYLFVNKMSVSLAFVDVDDVAALFSVRRG